ncbi:uncharacterized protein LOC110441330 [Mizuhopecten yessoensis]|uniref:uncharacterized protein LOC110441330 n=1 Tax=Mizuhopecten yessoensis TaxID=6573 RepID=UPI000B45B2D4|nr:uncharacterized protein LOC110441330 [Mizuhopecten yessoensis]
MLTAPEVPSNSTFMYYDRNAREIYNHFPVVPNKGITSEKGIIQYEMDTTPKRLLHTAYINAELYLVGLQQTVPVRQERQPTQRPKTQLQPDRQISRQPGVRRTSQADDAINDFFSEQSLFFLAQEIPTTKVWELMLQLGLRMNQIENIRSANQSDNKYKITLILYWNNENKNPPNSKLAILCGALKEVELTPVAEVLESVYNEHRSLKKGDFSNI